MYQASQLLGAVAAEWPPVMVTDRTTMETWRQNVGDYQVYFHDVCHAVQFNN